jgi:hypothetical protein
MNAIFRFVFVSASSMPANGGSLTPSPPGEWMGAAETSHSAPKLYIGHAEVTIVKYGEGLCSAE